MSIGQKGSATSTSCFVNGSGAGGSGTVLERRPLDTLSVNDLATLRRIIGEVIEAGCPRHGGAWLLNHRAAPMYPEERDTFAQEVIDRVIAVAIPQKETK